MNTTEFAPGTPPPLPLPLPRPKRPGEPFISRMGICLLGLAILAAAPDASNQAMGSPLVGDDTFVDFFPIPRFSGRIAILPDPAQPDLRRSRIGQTLAAWQMDRHVVYLTPEQMIDPSFFNVANFPVALYLGGERYWQTVRDANDGDAALQRHLEGGGRLLVLPYGPLPFFYDQKNAHVGSAGRFGMRLGVGNLQAAPEGRTLTFHRLDDATVPDSLPETIRFPMPYEADQRWRPISGAVGDGAVYQPWIALHDETGRTYGHGAAAVELASGARIVYVWCSLMACDSTRQTILLTTLRYALQDLAPPRPRLACLRTPEPPVVDGRLDEPIWRAAPTARLVDGSGARLLPTRYATAVQACWDDSALYLALRCQQPDRQAEHDVVEIWLTSDAGASPGLHLTLDAANRLEVRTLTWNEQLAVAAAKIDPPIQSVVRRGPDQWTAEIAVPLDAFDTSSEPRRFGDRQRLQVTRRIHDAETTAEPATDRQPDVWSPGLDPLSADLWGELVFDAHPWSDDFTGYPPGADGSSWWDFLDGTWRIEQGSLLGQDVSGDWSRLQGAMRGDQQWRDYSLEVRFRIEARGSAPLDGPWFAVRCNPDGDGYALLLGANTWQLHKTTFGVATRAHNCLAQGSWNPTDSWHTVRLEAVGNRLAGTMDGQPLFDVIDDAHLDLPSRREGGIMLVPARSAQSKGHTIIRYDRVTVDLKED